ncbi:unnamed protein product [Orchesella dallaii]|uniref:Uncharacterized protein n=1 Tax=Orchesella dallaii TaxID=48710 RepID=A0ABP1RFR4_9HEXA
MLLFCRVRKMKSVSLKIHTWWFRSYYLLCHTTIWYLRAGGILTNHQFLLSAQHNHINSPQCSLTQWLVRSGNSGYSLEIGKIGILFTYLSHGSFDCPNAILEEMLHCSSRFVWGHHQLSILRIFNEGFFIHTLDLPVGMER